MSFLRSEQGGEAIDDVLVAVNNAGLSFLLGAFHRMQIRMMDFFDFFETLPAAVLSQIHNVNLHNIVK